MAQCDLFETTRICLRECSDGYHAIMSSPHVRCALASAIRLHAAVECARGFADGARCGRGEDHLRESLQGDRRCQGRPARRNERDDHRLAAPAGECQSTRKALTDHDVSVAHQLADGHHGVREIAVRACAEALTLRIARIAVKDGRTVGSDGYEVNSGYTALSRVVGKLDPRLKRGGGDQRADDPFKRRAHEARTQRIQGGSTRAGGHSDKRLSQRRPG